MLPNWSLETPTIEKIAFDLNVDPFFMAAIRRAEAGREGREFGVLSEEANTYEAQARACAATIRHHLVTYMDNPLTQIQSLHCQRLCYSKAFIQQFANGWAPRGANNDPTGLNKNWLDNVCFAYFSYCAQGMVK